jgi:DNA primase
MISAEIIEAVRILCRIEEVIGEHVQLRRAGVQLLGRCPLHDDSSPSLAVHPGKQVFRCHGCGLGGDVFRFIELLLPCSFRRAVEHLAKRSGITIQGFQPSPELQHLVAEQRAHREAAAAFAEYWNRHVANVNAKYRALCRAATWAETFLRAGTLLPDEHELAWAALERYRQFEIQVEREGLVDLEVVRKEWETLQDAA